MKVYTQWFKNGDHPADNVWRDFEDTGEKPISPREGLVVRYYRNPHVSGKFNCNQCGNAMHNHGWIDQGEIGLEVCPSDWIISTTGMPFAVIPNMHYQKTQNVQVKNCKQCVKIRRELMAQIDWDSKRLHEYRIETPLQLIKRAYTRFVDPRIERLKSLFRR